MKSIVESIVNEGIDWLDPNSAHELKDPKVNELVEKFCELVRNHKETPANILQFLFLGIMEECSEPIQASVLSFLIDMYEPAKKHLKEIQKSNK